MAIGAACLGAVYFAGKFCVKEYEKMLEEIDKSNERLKWLDKQVISSPAQMADEARRLQKMVSINAKFLQMTVGLSKAQKGILSGSIATQNSPLKAYVPSILQNIPETENAFETALIKGTKNLTFNSEKSDFATILALVPADYQKYLEKATMTGAAEFKGSVKGLYYNEIYPAIDVLLAVTNASFKYQELPESVQDIQVLAQITKPEGDLNLLKVTVEKAHASIKNNPVDLSMNLSELMTDPNIDAFFAGTIDFTSLKQAIPIDSLDITGIMKAKMQIAGRMSSIEKKEYEKFKSNGEATIQNFRIESTQLTKPVEISQGQIKATTQQITVDQFNGKIGQSDFSLRGEVSNYLAYIFRKDVLKGNFNLKSAFMNFTELSNIMKPAAEPTASKTETKAARAPAAPADSVVAFQVPDKLDLSFQSTIQKAVYDKMSLNNINGLIRVKDRRLELTNLTMDMLQGKVAVIVSYTSNPQNKP
ncbi:MAG: hypothetical protein Q8K69_16520, partial [Bacteroidota bacterium]|nr:hypothetical protein [Bacteroidota bacterium]